MPIFAEYQQKTTRQIPVLVFMRIDCAPCSVRAELAGTGVMVTFTSWQDILRADIGICSKSIGVLDVKEAVEEDSDVLEFDENCSGIFAGASRRKIHRT